jgi:hypothetical protein
MPKKDTNTSQLFHGDQADLLEKSWEERQAEKSGPVECLGMTFESDEARRAYFIEKLREKLEDPEFRKIEGFPIGSDEDILNLSDPPYYTACPNPFIEDFVGFYGRQSDPSVLYGRAPFAVDVSEGKSDPIYGAHTYHTKVPPKAIARYLLHYTDPGDLVLDGFSGTGMSGVAAQLCGDRTFVEDLGYRVDKDGTIYRKELENGKDAWQPFSKIGHRRPILNDLSPIATFVTNNYGRLFDLSDFCAEALAVVSQLEREIGWVYQQETDHVTSGIWSDVFYCPICNAEVVYWDAAVKNGEINKTFPCPSCHGIVGKATSKADGAVKLDRAYESKLDKYLGTIVNMPKIVLVEQNLNKGKNSKKVKSDSKYIYELFSKIDDYSPLSSVPITKFEKGRQTNKLINGSGIEYVHWMYTPRALFVYGKLWDIQLSSLKFTSMFHFCLSGINNYISRKQGYFGGGGGVSGTLFTPSVHLERNIFEAIRRKIKAISKIKRSDAPRGCVSTQSSGCLKNISDETIDYIFIDPPFGENFQYAELNSFVEAWLKVKSNTQDDYVMNYVHKKDLTFYMHSMRSAFREFYRVLKPGHWMTVEFSNTQASVWNAIQSSLQESGFVVANVSALDKKQGSFNAVTSTTSVKQDLVISAYKPNGGLEARFEQSGGNIDSAWDFVSTHLGCLPVVKIRTGALEFITERDPRILFDRMVAWFIGHNVAVPVSSQEFQAGLVNRFIERDGMFFLPDQAAEYDKKRLKTAAVKQLEFFVCDERSSIDWLSNFLKRRPSTYQDLHPLFISQLGIGWKKHEATPELLELLEDNFIQYRGDGPVPPQIHSYLSSNHKDLRNLDNEHHALVTKAKGRWYVPDPNNAIDLENFRERTLLREFETYKVEKKKLKVFRLEAVRAGFKTAYSSGDYETIVSVAAKIPDKVIQEDEKLLMYYDVASMRLGED